MFSLEIDQELKNALFEQYKIAKKHLYNMTDKISIHFRKPF